MTRRHCYPRTYYSVGLNYWKKFTDGGGINFMQTPRLARARVAAKKLPLKRRQIDVLVKGQKPYVLEGSWL